VAAGGFLARFCSEQQAEATAHQNADGGAAGPFRCVLRQLTDVFPVMGCPCKSFVIDVLHSID